MIPLPPSALNVVGSARKKAEYNAALEEWTADIWNEIEHGVYAGPRAHLSVVFYVSGARPEDGRFRPECSRRVWPVLDGVYEAVKRAGSVETTEQIVVTSAGVLPVAHQSDERIEIAISRLGESA